MTEDICDEVQALRKVLVRGLGTDFADATPLHGIALSLHKLENTGLRIAEALERIAEAQEKACG